MNQVTCQVTKVKYEHIHLTSFSKMRVDLAAQVIFILVYLHQCITMLAYIIGSYPNSCRVFG